MTKTDNQSFRWAVLGTGSVSRKFVHDLRRLGDRVEVHTVASRTSANAQAFARDFGVAHVAPDYGAAAVADVDALYIATPPALHEAHALMGIRAGKAVLIEKPLALTAQAAQRIAHAAQIAGVFCMEAMWTRFQPLLQNIKTQIDAGALGDVRGFDARFMGANKVQSGVGLFEPDQGGGALMHRGVYPLSLARYLLGEVAQMHTMAHPGDSGVDDDSVLILRHTNGALSTIRASLRTTGPLGAVVYGTKATLHIEGPIWRPTGARLRAIHPMGTDQKGVRRFEEFRESSKGLHLSSALAQLKDLLGRGQTKIKAPFSGNGYHYEARALMEAVAAGQQEDARMPLSESIEIMKIIDDARASWNAGTIT
jgi:predicted dehydrogenase